MEILISCICSVIVSSVISIIISKKIMIMHLNKYRAMFYLGESDGCVKLCTLEEFIDQKKSQRSAGTK